MSSLMSLKGVPETIRLRLREHFTRSALAQGDIGPGGALRGRLVLRSPWDPELACWVLLAWTRRHCSQSRSLAVA